MPPKVYFAVVGSAKNPRQQALIKSLLEDVRLRLRGAAIASAVNEVAEWSADKAVIVVPQGFTRYVVVSSVESEQSGLGPTTKVIFEVGRLEPLKNGERKLVFASMSQDIEVIVAQSAPDKPAAFTKYINDDWRPRPNSQIALEVLGWIMAMLPELQQSFTFYLMCSEVNKTWTVEDILSSESDMDGTVSAFLVRLAQILENGPWQPPWQSVFSDLASQPAAKVICGTLDQGLKRRAHYFLRGILTDAHDAASGGRRMGGVSVKWSLEDQVSTISFKGAKPPLNAPNWEEEFLKIKSAVPLTVRDVGDMCADHVGVLTRNPQFANSVARSIRMKVYGDLGDNPLEANWRCH